MTLSGYSIGEPGSVLADIGIETTGYVWTVANPLRALTNGIERTLSFIDGKRHRPGWRSPPASGP